MTITCRFTPKDKGPVAEAAIEFHEDCGPLAGFEINSIAIWRKKDGPGYYASFPSRQYQDKTGAKKYHTYITLRRDPAIPDSQKWALGNWVVSQYENHIGEGRGTF
jgi:hypothetical protein